MFVLLGLIWVDLASASAFCLLTASWSAFWIPVPPQHESPFSYFGYLSSAGAAFLGSQHSPPGKANPGDVVGDRAGASPAARALTN
jgi:hypothetical protein